LASTISTSRVSVLSLGISTPWVGEFAHPVILVLWHWVFQPQSSEHVFFR
jgi:hypothetical protein